MINIHQCFEFLQNAYLDGCRNGGRAAGRMRTDATFLFHICCISTLSTDESLKEVFDQFSEEHYILYKSILDVGETRCMTKAPYDFKIEKDGVRYSL